MPEEKDIFRDTLLRYMGYANEVGESFRPVVDVKLVHLSYALASGYVLADTISKSRNVWKNSLASKEVRAVESLKTATDVLLWQSFASVIVPGFTINRLCYVTRHILNKTPLYKRSKWISVGVGLLSIPVIIHPIDHGVDYVMDKTIRPLLGIK